MVFDAVCAAIFVLCVIVGYMKGVLRAVFLVGCVAAAYYGSQPLAEPIGGYLRRWTGMKPAIVLTIGRTAAAVGIYAVCSIVTSPLAHFLGRDERGFMKSWNRQLGALVGLTCGSVLIFAGVCVADALVKRMPGRNSYIFRSLRSSRLRRYVSDVNPLQKRKQGESGILPDLSPSGHSILPDAKDRQSRNTGFTKRNGYRKIKCRDRRA